MVQESRLTFSALPLTEVCLRLAPAVPLPLDPISLAQLVSARPESDWTARHIKKPYDGFGRACIPITGESYGVELVSPDRAHVVVLQTNLLQVFWRNYNLNPEREYPGFTKMLSVLSSMVDTVANSWSEDEENPPHFNASNLRYTNFVATPEPPRGLDLVAYVKKELLPRYKPDQIVHEFESCWREDDRNQTDVRLHLQIGATKEHDYGFEITTSAGHFFSDDYPPIQEITEDHEFLLTFFTEVITKKALRKWGFKNE